MGKSLIIKGADFSANGIQETVILDITSRLSSIFEPRISIGSFFGSGNPNEKRCCIRAFTFESIGVDISKYSKIKVSVKNGYDYVFGTGPTPGVADGWQGWDGETGGQKFTWTIDNQMAEASVDNTTLAMSLNFRYDDDTTAFSESTALTDIVESIVLVFNPDGNPAP